MTHAIDVCTNMKGDVIKDALICDEIEPLDSNDDGGQCRKTV